MSTVICTWVRPKDGGGTITHYTLQRRVGDGTWTTIAQPSGSATSFADTTAVAGASHTYRLCAHNSAGPGPFSADGVVTTTSAVAVHAVPMINTYSGLAWASGSAGEETPNGKFAQWRGRENDIAVVHVDGNEAMVDQYPFVWNGSSDYPSWTRHVDVSIGAFGRGYQPSTGAGESWAGAAAGHYDQRWTACLQNLRSRLHTRVGADGKPPKVFIRFAHEWNGNWYPWSVADWWMQADAGTGRPASTMADFRAAWVRFRALQRRHFPESFVVCNVNREQVGVTEKWELWLPDPDTYDVYGVDYYNNYRGAFTQAEFDASALETGAWGSIKGIELHRRKALALGKPISVSEWGGNADEPNPAAVDPANPGDSPAFIQAMHGWFAAHAGNGPGQLLYEGYWNSLMGAWVQYRFHLFSDPQTVSGNGYQATRMPLSAAKYRELWSSPALGGSTSAHAPANVDGRSGAQAPALPEQRRPPSTVLKPKPGRTSGARR